MDKGDFEFHIGNYPVLISASHAQPYYRRNLTGTYRSAEEKSDEIAKSIAEKTESSFIYLNKAVDYDPNYKISNPFKEEIGNIVDLTKASVLLDIHGLSSEKKYDFGIYFPRNYHKSKQIAQLIQQYIEESPSFRGSLIHILNTPDIADRRESVSRHVASKYKIPSVQIEISSYIRQDQELRNAFIDALVEFIPNI